MLRRRTSRHGTPLVGVRDWINRNAVQVIVLCLAGIATAAIILKTSYPEPPPKVTHVWFADSATGDLVAVPHDSLSPLVHDGRELWRAHLFACGECEEPFVGYYTKFNDEALAQIQARHAERARRMKEFADRRRKAEAEGASQDELDEWEMWEYEDEEEYHEYDEYDVYGFGYMYPPGLLYSVDGQDWKEVSRSSMRELREHLRTRCPEGLDLEWCSPYPKPHELAELAEPAQTKLD